MCFSNIIRRYSVVNGFSRSRDFPVIIRRAVIKYSNIIVVRVLIMRVVCAYFNYNSWYGNHLLYCYLSEHIFTFKSVCRLLGASQPNYGSRELRNWVR